MLAWDSLCYVTMDADADGNMLTTMTTEFHLVHQSDMGSVTASRLQAGEQIVGRLLESQLCLLDPSVSRQHAKIDVRDGHATVFDLGSANGTFVNGERIQQAKLKPGDEVRFGSLRFRLTSSASRRPLADENEATMDAEEAKQQRALHHPCAVKLTEAEKRIYLELLTLKTEQRIADDRYLAKETVHNHAKQIYIKFGVHSKAELIRKVMGGGL